MQELKIEAYDLYDYTNKVIEAGKQGYVTSTDNAKYPFNFTGYFFAILVKKEVTEEEQIKSMLMVAKPTEVKEPVLMVATNKGRPKKV